MKNRFFSHTIYSNYTFPSLHFSHQCPLPQPSRSSRSTSPFSLQKKAGLQDMVAKEEKIRYNKTIQKLSYGGQARQTPKWKGLPRSGKRVRGKPALTVRRCGHLNVIGSHKIKGSVHIGRCGLIKVYCVTVGVGLDVSHT